MTNIQFWILVILCDHYFMLPIPADIVAHYEAVLEKRKVPVSLHADYRKWLRYYLDFLIKYPPPDSKSEQVRLFIGKLRDKKQSQEQQKQAAHALSLFFESQMKKKASPSSTGVLPQKDFNKPQPSIPSALPVIHSATPLRPIC